MNLKVMQIHENYGRKEMSMTKIIAIEKYQL